MHDVPEAGRPDPEPTEEEELVDAALADSFPASDPPPWTLGPDTRRP